MKDNNRFDRLSDAEFKCLFGVGRETFAQMLGILTEASRRLHGAGGSPPKLSVTDKLRITLQYLREYRTMAHIAFDWGVAKSTVFESVRWVEDTLAGDGTLRLPGRKALRGEAPGIQVVVVDVTESPIQRPQKNRGNITPGRKNGTR